MTDLPGGQPHLAPVLEIGGTHVTGALADLFSGTIVPGTPQRRSLDPAGSASGLLATVVECARAVPAGAGDLWAVALPGPFDYERGVGLFAGVGKFEALYGVDVRRALMDGLPGPPGGVAFLNDADAFLWGEWCFGAAVGYDPCAAVTLGTGIGSAFVSGGRLLRAGRGVPPEGRVDLLRIDGRPLEDVVSTRAIERAYREATGTAPNGTAQVAALARGGDRAAATALCDALGALGHALAPWLEDFGAKALVVGGSMTGSWDVVGPPFLAAIGAGPHDRLGDLAVRVAAHPEHAALLGAGAHARGWARPGLSWSRPGPERPSQTSPGL